MTAPPFGRTVPGNRWDLAYDDAAELRTVSVVVTHFEQPRQLARTLAALERQTRPADQVLVADDGSAYPPQAAPGITVLRQEDRGFRAAAARNLGARHATGDLLVFLDADTTPEPDFLARITHLPARLPELFAVGRRRHADLSADLSAAPGAGPRELAEPGWLRQGYLDTDNLRRADHTSHRFVISAVLACSRWWFTELGGFDERFVGYGGEDWELAYRSWREGGLVAHVPDAMAWHDGPAVGADDRPVGSVDDTQLSQTLALADRVGAPGSTYRGLLSGPVDVVVTVTPGLSRRALTVTLDSLLAGLPRCRVALPAATADWFAGDPRIVADPAGADDGVVCLSPRHGAGSGTRLHLHLTAPAIGPPGAWADAVAAQVDDAGGAEPAATAVLEATDGTEIGRLHDLRQFRRARRWDRDDLLDTRAVRTPLRPADGVSLQAWLEGWC